MKRYALWVTLMFILAGCAVVTAPTPGAAPTLGVVRTSPVSPLAPLSPLSPLALPQTSDGLVIVYERDGGIAGTHDVWRIYADGRVQATLKAKGSTQAQLSAGVVNDAVKSIVDGGFFKLQDSYLPANRGADRFTYRLTIIQGRTLKTVTTMDATEQPAALSNALNIVGGLVRQAAQK
jgi:hypothetical protein